MHFDLCRYLSRGFAEAYAHVDPHVVVFLGDLLDEGSTASESEYELTWSRFNNIFRVGDQTKVKFVLCSYILMCISL